ncbi:MAG TPA: hypothetical protein VFJ17_11195 [Mycobacteriales bacterium]|nr:hypothetical protein [Mycobacteriales bacterium]
MSAVIYAAIVVMWAVVLVPMWLRRHDAATESRSVERFSTAMRTLSRRTHATPGRRYVVMPRRQAGAVSVHVTGAAVGAAVSARPARPAPSAARATMVRRRRRTTLVLLGLVTLTLLLATAGAFPWLLQVVLDLILVAFLAHLRTQARRAAAVARQRRQAPVAAAPPARPAARPAPARAASAAMAQPVEVASADVSWTEELRAGSAFEVQVQVDETWQPVPVPPPTYTLKPPAPAPASAAYDSQTTEEMERVIVDEVPTELDEILERRWAVND